MDWHPPQQETTWVLDDIFDREKGWSISDHEAPVERKVTEGNPNYLVTIGRITMLAYEQKRWSPGSEIDVWAGRLCVTVEYFGITITNAEGLLFRSYETRGLPSFGINPDNRQPTLQTAFPIAPNYPVDLARRQVMVCMGLLAVQGEELLAAWNANKLTPRSPGRDREFDWDLAGSVAGVAAKFLRGFVGF
jgi:hypothetical protein